MKTMACEREQETLRAVLNGAFWHELHGSDDVRAHVDGCDICREVVAVAAALRADRDESLRDVRVPAAGQVWWRSALRAHAEATEKARRPMVWLQGIAGACAVGVVAALITLAWPSMYDAALAVAALRHDVEPLVEALGSVLPFAIGVLACLVVTPIVVYFALSDK